MLLRKLIVFAITSGLAKKAFDRYRARKAVATHVQGRPRSAASTRSTPYKG